MIDVEITSYILLPVSSRVCTFLSTLFKHVISEKNKITLMPWSRAYFVLHDVAVFFVVPTELWKDNCNNNNA